MSAASVWVPAGGSQGTPLNRNVASSSTSAGHMVTEAVADISGSETLLLYRISNPLSMGGGRALKVPLRVHVEREDDQYTVSDNTVLLLYGSGDSFNAALEDYGSAILEYQQMLLERERDGRLGINQRPQLAFLNRILPPR